MADLAPHTGSSTDGTRAVGHIFLSYASEDSAVARLLAEELTRLGYGIWWDRLIAGGALWGHEIERALDEARAVIVLWSPASVESEYVRAEARAAAHRKTIIPAIIEPCELPMPFGEFQSIDLTTWRAAGDPAALDGLRRALDRIDSAAAAASSLDAVSLTGGARRAVRTGIAAYAADLVHMVTGPKAFLRQRSAEARFAPDAVRFFGMSIALELAIGLPVALKVGGTLRWELLGAALYQPARLLLIGTAIHLSWRAVGGRAPALKTLATFAYVYGVLLLLYSCTQNLAVGVLRALRPTIAERVFSGAGGAGLEVMMQVIVEEGLAPAAAFLLFVTSPLIVVPFVCWGAFRHQHQVSRAGSLAAAAIALVLGTLAYAATVMLSYVGAGPG